jgi:arsenate reductase (thioredoxin)
VLFVCEHNAGRSQIAAALTHHLSKGWVGVRSAGTHPEEQIDPVVVQAMGEIGVDVALEFPKPLSEELVRAADVVVTLGCGDACPVYPAGATWIGRWPTPRGSHWASCARSAMSSSTMYGIYWRRWCPRAT